MGFRSQFVSIGAARSAIRTVDSGVPQGSVLGPVLYSLYTNKLPDIIKNSNCPKICHQNKEDLFGKNSFTCGQVPVFADDCTLIVADKDPERNKVKFREKLQEVTEFLNNNDLIVNQDKTTVQNYMVKQKRAKIECDPTVLTVEIGDETII